MLRISKKAEYGMLALQRIAQSNETVPVKEIADMYGISFDLLAKVLNQLAKAGLVTAYQGTQGGYLLAKKPVEITVADILHTLEGSLKITECADTHSTSCGCTLDTLCAIKTPMQIIQEKMLQVFSSMTLSDMIQTGAAHHTFHSIHINN
ncbi:MAG: RrF2 family transcriptional regulator [Candidatus Kapaibacterium sp.]|jgi:Rrf2 family protein|nr:Rrf2 family transcriptional regulator [Candidatus Kapabacteria bacterium]HRE57666.1 Rrf2 family transcriptional regulator [Candidatus Kapabacteria bacterium]HRI30553.1 Rrf2 family transcriptional regulator [Candidatus Kapabacteria bacterium]HRK59032.1 Rrf2 family transcriptional regulator [Candidatus Kapabacteria bacterium]